MCRANFYVNVEKLLITGSFISYWSCSEEASIFVFNLKAENALATSSTFLPDVFKPQTDELFVESFDRQIKKVLILL